MDLNAGSSISIAEELNKSLYTFIYHTLLHVFFKQSKLRKQPGACSWEKLVQAQSLLALSLFIKILLGVCLQKRPD